MIDQTLEWTFLKVHIENVYYIIEISNFVLVLVGPKKVKMGKDKE